jgi:hypothetical protein
MVLFFHPGKTSLTTPCLTRVMFIRMSLIAYIPFLLLTLGREPVDLELSAAQRETFAGWKRPQETFGHAPKNQVQPEITMTPVNKIDLVQDITTDCSVVASLCATVSRNLRGHTKVYPDLADFQTVY